MLEAKFSSFPKITFDFLEAKHLLSMGGTSWLLKVSERKRQHKTRSVQCSHINDFIVLFPNVCFEHYAFNRTTFYFTPLQSSGSIYVAWILDCASSGRIFCFIVQASQSGYGVDFVAQGQAGFPGSYLNQNSQPGYSHSGTGNDFISQVGGLQNHSSVPAQLKEFL